MVLTPTSELDAVNVLLGAIGESPVSDLYSAGSVDAAIARDTLRAVSREVQSRGWWFNEQESFTFTLTTDKKAVAPNAVLSLRPVRGGVPVVIRGTRVVNPRTGTDTFETAPVADVVWFLDYEQLPETARRYIAIRAARIFQTQVLGSDQLYVFNEAHEGEAYAIFAAEHNDFEFARGRNYLTGSASVTDIWDI